MKPTSHPQPRLQRTLSSCRDLLTRPAAAILAAGLIGASQAATPEITVQVDQPGAPINPAMWGVFFEDINSGADGGLYAELVKNRSFEFADPLLGWAPLPPAGMQGSCEVRTDAPLNAANPHYLRLTVNPPGPGPVLVNEGFNGMGVRQGETYRFSVFARTPGSPPKSLRLELVSTDGRVLGATAVGRFGPRWQRHTATLRSAGTDPKARLRVSAEGQGIVDLDMISLFPARTWKNRPGSLRADLVQTLADLKPGFVRFPGGCIVEGRYLATRYQWKATLGAPEQRRVLINRWNDEFKHRPAPDYYQSFGLGFFEYFQLCEDLGAEPLPILNCGMACQFNSGELVPMDQLDPFIQDALDLIEFANGPVSSPWGKKRAQLGHPKPFRLKLLGVGNEQWGPQYIERYAAFARVLKARHPEIQLISSAGPSPDDDRFHYLWGKLREQKADIVDEHCYALPDWFLDNAGRYDGYPADGPKVFMGEYAAQSVKVVSPDNRNDWGCALAEAAYMTGLERNARAVVMASYAPLFGHEERWQWRPNLIWMDNLQVYGTPSYYVQQLFSRNRGDQVLPTRLSGTVPSAGNRPRFYASAVRDAKAGEVILKVVNATSQAVEASVNLAGVRRVSPQARAVVLTSASLADENSIATPKKVAPAAAVVPDVAPRFNHAFPAYSFTVMRLRPRP